MHGLERQLALRPQIICATLRGSCRVIAKLVRKVFPALKSDGDDTMVEDLVAKLGRRIQTFDTAPWIDHRPLPLLDER